MRIRKSSVSKQNWNNISGVNVLGFSPNCIIFYNTFILSALLTQAEKAERVEEAKVIKGISPIAWRHVNLLGRFEFQRPHDPLDIDELIRTVEQEIVWQKQKLTDEQLD
jgi:hypothetical protein